jgi:dTDP-D-glucose 4,6-dehydratase
MNIELSIWMYLHMQVTLENLKDIVDNPKLCIYQGGYQRQRKMDEIFTSYDIDTVVNFAAESYVDRSTLSRKFS